jgi:D-ribose pyranose/furanose isomerase RbsD
MLQRWMLMFLIVAVMIAIGAGGCTNKLRSTSNLNEIVKKLGHRNWIVVTDSAYPWQNAPGIKTIVVNCEQEKEVHAVLAILKKVGHVQPTVFLDKELEYVSEKNAPGIGEYRSRLDELLKGYSVVRIKHEELIARLDASSKMFEVVIIKTNMKLPYTSVFMELGCGYWNDEAEKELRESF